MKPNTHRGPKHQASKPTDEYLRLYEAATKLQKSVTNQTSLARFLGVAPQDITNWKARGIPKDKIVPIAMKIGCRSEWLLTGEGEMDGSKLDQLFDALPKHIKQSALDFIGYQISGNAHSLVAGDKVSTYHAMIESIRADMERKKNGDS